MDGGCVGGCNDDGGCSDGHGHDNNGKDYGKSNKEDVIDINDSETQQ